jgi:hypothetical protein
MSEATFDLNAFIKESKDVLVNPKAYFSTMKTSGGMTEPIIKAVVYGAVAGVIAFLWSLLNIGAAAGGILGGSIGIMIFISYIIGSIIGLFVGAVIVMIISSICKGSTDFESNVRVTAAVMVLMPVSALLGFTGHFSIYLGLIFSLAVSLYSMWLLYNALIETLKATPETTKIVMYILIAIIVLFTLLGLGAKRKANQIMKEFDNSELKELIK